MNGCFPFPTTASRIAAAALFPRPKCGSTRENSAMLDKLKSFLPQLAQANQQLSRDLEVAGEEKFNIEHIDDDVEQCIEMVRHTCSERENLM